MKNSMTLCFVLVALLLGSCSTKSDPVTRDRVSDKDVNTRHTKGTTDVLKNYRLPDVRPAKDPKEAVKRDDVNPNAKPKPRSTAR